jgi:hypothetical protein
MKNDKISAFKVNVPPEVLADLRQRLKNTRWAYQVKAQAGMRGKR